MVAERERRITRSAALATTTPRGMGRRTAPPAQPENLYVAFGLRWWWLIALCTLLGLLAGLIIGRLIWSRVVGGIGAIVKSVVPMAVVVGASLAAIGLALLLSLAVGRHTSGLRLTEMLRTE